MAIHFRPEPGVIEVVVDGVDALAEGETKTFAFQREGEERGGFVLRFEGELFAYANRCPHWRVDLDMGEGRFFSQLTQRIFCSNHGALFVPNTGECEVGPCRGRSLERFEVAVTGSLARVRIPDDTAGRA